MKVEELRALALVNAESLGLTPRKVQLVLEKIDATEECWFWTASKKENGYGQFNLGRKNWNAHRLVYLLSGRRIPEGLVLDHLCTIKSCVNPDHLEPVPQLINARRWSESITHCSQGHEYTEETTYIWRGGRACRRCRIERAADRRGRLRG